MNTIKEKTLEVNYDDVYKFFDTVHRLICNDMKLDYDLGKDLCQEGFLKAFIKMETLKCSTTCEKTKDLIIFTWIKTIVKNTIIYMTTTTTKIIMTLGFIRKLLI